MKEIKAYIQPHKLTAVEHALHKIDGLTGMSVTEIKGFGRDRKPKNAKPKADQADHLSVEYVRHLKLEIICKDEVADAVVEAVRQSAHTGLRGDGKIYVSEILSAVRISTNETGDTAV